MRDGAWRRRTYAKLYAEYALQQKLDIGTDFEVARAALAEARTSDDAAYFLWGLITFGAAIGGVEFGGSGDFNVQNLRRLTNREVRKYGLHAEKQAWGLPGDTTLYVDKTTGHIYYQVERGALYEYMTTIEKLKSKR